MPGLTLRRGVWSGDLDGMLERGYIRVLVVPSRTMYFYDRGRPRGVTWEAFTEFQRQLNRKLNRRVPVHIVFVPTTRDRLISALVEGKGDIAAANLTITESRKTLVDFSDPIVGNVSEIAVTGPQGVALGSLDDLAGKEVHVRKSSSYYDSLVLLNDRFRARRKPQVVIRVVEELLEDEDLLEMVNAGMIGITVTDSHKARFWKQVFDGIQLHPDVAISDGQSIGWAFRRDSPQLEKVLNDFVAEHKAGTAFGNTVLKRYLQDTRWVKNSLSPQEMQKYQAVENLFQKYGGMYDLDWQLVAAQAYQESTLDHSVRSSVGAIGIMQVMPVTATAAPISIANPDRLEDNIHAGVKILKLYQDTYFNDSAIDELNRMLFAFAAYNAGPNRINRLRDRAAKEGLDSNVWFKNVEQIVSKSIGREPVQYVANVYKYFLAYKFVAEQEEERRRAVEGN